MAFSIERTIIITLIFIGYTHADSPRILEKMPNDDYKVVDENFTGLLFMLHVQDADTGDMLYVEGEDTFTKFNFNITSNPFHGQGNDIAVHVSVINGLDRETLGDSVKVKLLITDGQTPKRYTFTVYIQDINDNPPVFQNQPYNLEIPELPCSKTTAVYTRITAIDLDKNANGRVSYSMEANAQSSSTRAEYDSTFRIDNRTGSITQTKCLDYRSNSYYLFTVTAKDGGPNGGLKTTTDFFIRVKDVQNQPPFFTGIPYRRAINENNQKGSSVLTINARDGDSGVSNEVNYTITGCSCGDNFFDIGVKSGIITTKTVVDRDSGPIKYQSGNCDLVVLVQEEDHGLFQWGITTATTIVTIIVNDIDDNRPAFEEIKYSAYVHENMPKDSLLQLNRKIFVHDKDQGDNARMRITLENTDNSLCTDFVASPSEIQGRGSVSLLVNNPTLLDYEALKNKTLHIQVVAAEVKNISSKTKVPLEINVQDTNDNYPKFNTTKFTISIPENTRNNTIITRITAQDADTYPQYNDIIYSVSGGSGRFTVDPDTGYIRTLCKDCDKELDREVRSDFYLTLFATDKGGNRNSTEVIVILTDMNDNKPQFSRPVYTVFLEENSKKLDVVDVDASDRDQEKSNNSQFTFSIINSTPLMNNLTINKTTGEIKLKTSLDYEKLTNPNGIVNITVEVKDEGSPSLNSTCEVMLTVQDKNDNYPIFNQTIYYGNVAEDRSSNITFSTSITKVTATDKDVTAQNKRMSYFKTAGSDKFFVDSSTGIIRITMNSYLDREYVSEYNLTIIAIDQGSPPLTGTTTVTINVTDVSDEKPEFDNQEYTASVKENTTSNHDKIIQTCNASDFDLDSLLFYKITEVEARDENGKSVDGTLVKDYFDINKDNGSVFVSGTLDRETAATVRLRIQVTDLNVVHNKPQTDYAYLTITLTDINDNFPIFEKTQYNISVSEGAENGRKYDGPKASDRDVNRTISYKLLPGPYPINSFTIDAMTGEIVKVGELDRETYSSLLLTVFATDNGVPLLNSSVSVYVRVLDVNDNPPEFSIKSRGLKEVYIDENAAVGEVIININATDKDEGPNNNNIIYFLEQHGYFSINEADLLCNNKRIQAMDRDINANGRVSYLIQAKTQFSDAKQLNEKTFSIDNGTGAITLNKSLNNEYINYYQLTVTAKDAGPNGGLTATATFVVHVKDVKENTTLFTGMPYNLTTVSKGHTQSHRPYLANNTNGDYSSFPENFTGTVFQIHVKDEDIGDKITADAADHITRAYFDIILVPSTPNDVWISVTVKKDLDRETLGNVVHVRLRIKDSQQNDLTYVFTLHIYDINDNDPVFQNSPYPVFQNSPYILEIPEVPCNINSTIFTQILALDKDSGDNGKVTYSMVPKQQTIHSQDLFSIDSTTGHIFLNACLDYENGCYHQFIVTAKDSGPGCRRSATAELVVLVQDVPE